MATNTKKYPISQSFHQLSKLTQMNILNKLSQLPHQKKRLHQNEIIKSEKIREMQVTDHPILKAELVWLSHGLNE